MRAFFLLGLLVSPSLNADRVFLFEDVTAITMGTPSIVEQTSVLVVDGRIVALGDVAEVPSAAKRIDGRGRFLLPGLADMHVHIPTQEHFWLYLANGVTTVRNMWGSPIQREWQDQIAAGELIGPRIYSVGPLMDGPAGFWRSAVTVADAADAATAVRRVAQAGYPGIKVYNDLSAEAYRALVRAATRAGLRVEGHVPKAVGLAAVIAAGQFANEHLSGFEQATLAARFRPSLAGKPSRTRLRTLARLARSINDGSLTLAEVHDPALIDEFARRSATAGMWNIPTLVLHTGYDDRRTRDAMRYLDPLTRDRWPDDPSVNADRRAIVTVWHRYRLSLVRALDAAGAPWLVGTDAPNAFVVPGFSIHQELEHLVAAGVSHERVLRAATVDAASFIGAPDGGRIGVGARADLVLLDANPLEGFETMTRPLGVMVQGRWLPRALLEERLAAIAARHAAPRRLPAAQSRN